jgi:tetratricopeptide (TPR) repeat protein
MYRLILVAIAIGLLFAGSVVLAQTATPVAPASDNLLPTIEALATQVATAAAQVANSAQTAGESFDRASNFLGIFEAIGLIVSLLGAVITVAAVVGGILGIRGLNTAKTELEESRKQLETELEIARQRFEDEMKQRQAELNSVRTAMENSAKEQRDNAAKANLALSLLQVGERQYKASDLSGAINTYKRALELDPTSLITHYRLGYVYVQSGNLTDAEKHLTIALDIEKDFPPAIAALGYVYRRMGEKLSTGIERDTLLNKGESYLLKALTASPKLVDEDDEAWWGSLGGLYRRRGQTEAAIEAYRKAAEATPSSSYAYSNLALLYVQTSNKEKMLPTYERVEQLALSETLASVDNYWAYADLLTARLALGKVTLAEETLKSIFRTAPVDSPYALESLLDTLHRLELALGRDNATHVRQAVERIQTEVERRTNEKKAALAVQN